MRIYLYLMSAFVALTLASAAGAQPGGSKEVSLQLGPAPGQPAAQGLLQERPARASVGVLRSIRVSSPPPRHRSSELHESQLVVQALDASGREVYRVPMADPRMLRLESADPATGELSMIVRYQETADLTVAVPDDPRIRTIRISQPHWTGKAFVLDTLAETPLQ